MDDLISRQATLDALTEYWKGISDRHPTLDGEMAVYADCKGIIKRLPSAQPHWIPCSDRLPKEKQECLVCRNGRIMIDKFIGRDIPYKWHWTVSDYEAWMPLPDFYKGEQK